MLVDSSSSHLIGSSPNELETNDIVVIHHNDRSVSDGWRVESKETRS
jgi:hypothetical protein